MRFRCILCRGKGLLGTFEFEADRMECPKCGASGPAQIALLVDVHFMEVTRDGQILAGGRRHKVACQPRREILAAHRYDDFNATGDPRAVTCPSCKTTRAWRHAAMAYPELRFALAQSDPFVVSGDGCCG